MLEVIIAIGAGLILGSFTSVVIERLGRTQGIVGGRSECPRCEHTLSWYDLFPLVSYMMLRGRCRYCHTAISWHYPVTETVMAGSLGFYIYMNGYVGGLSLLEGGIIAGLVMLFFFDLRHQLLPDALVVPTAMLAVLRIALYGMPEPVSAGVGALALMVPFGLLHSGSGGRWMGFGDVGLAAVLGLLLGWPTVMFVLIFAVWIGAVVGVFLMWLGRANMKSALPFGSFLAAVAIGALIQQKLFIDIAYYLGL